MTNQYEVQINQKEATSNVLKRLDQMTNEGLAMPKDYNAANALNIAYLKLVDMKVKGQPLLNVVTKKSVYESLLNMVLQGLSPAKNQVYFIPYGNELQMQRSYFGTQAALKRLGGVKDIWAEVIREGEEFEFENVAGRKRLVKHEQKFETLDNNIVGAYAIIDTKEDGQLLEIMTKKQIDASWSQAKSSNVHNKFSDQMAMRTVINRAAKNYINTSDDSDLLVHAINDTTENEYDDNKRARDVTGTGSDEGKAQDLLSNFKAIKAQEEPVEDPAKAQGFTDEQIEMLNGKSEEKQESKEDEEQSEAEYADFEEVNDDWLPPTDETPVEADFNDLTIIEIKERLSELNVKYDSNARKEELVGLLEMATSGGVQDGLF